MISDISINNVEDNNNIDIDSKDIAIQRKKQLLTKNALACVRLKRYKDAAAIFLLGDYYSYLLCIYMYIL